MTCLAIDTDGPSSSEACRSGGVSDEKAVGFDAKADPPASPAMIAILKNCGRDFIIPHPSMRKTLAVYSAATTVGLKTSRKMLSPDASKTRPEVSEQAG